MEYGFVETNARDLTCLSSMLHGKRQGKEQYRLFGMPLGERQSKNSTIRSSMFWESGKARMMPSVRGMLLGESGGLNSAARSVCFMGKWQLELCQGCL